MGNAASRGFAYGDAAAPVPPPLRSRVVRFNVRNSERFSLAPFEDCQEDERLARCRAFFRAIVARAYEDIIIMPPVLWDSQRAEIEQRKRELAESVHDLKERRRRQERLYAAQRALDDAESAERWLSCRSVNIWSYRWLLDVLGEREPPHISDALAFT